MTRHELARQRARDRAADGVATREEIAVRPTRPSPARPVRTVFGPTGPPHGMAARYKRGCRCDDCRRANSRAELDRKQRVARLARQ